ncbi:PREDICTED: zinc finger matrin-type protein 4-like isoform X2 [Nicrophorus vespilloides]|uniref:Zinc finger matrin-type protein 4-like isoform X2 n=1 Tax=Nicrophorus vespilloides TaxID=110193 RepID=A0ABM1MPW3_NICVS|nr:PREDICTED: zinc finger matrin-type protein 4-like isoform X2 [Nicrophorus vespilloides]
MECASDGTIIRVKELDRSFTIPKRRGEQSLLPATGQQPDIEHKSILQADCDEVLKTLKRPASDYRKSADVVQHHNRPSDLTDTSLPKELRDQIQPLYCGVCKVQLINSISAKIHYASKNHDKNIRKFLISYSFRTGEPLHKRARWDKKPISDDNDPKYFHCKACDLPLTGKAHAESHYMGKIHQKVISGTRKPAGRGYIDNSGHWKRSFIQIDPSGRDGFGAGFAALENHPEKVNSLSCDLCHVKVTSYPQMENHIQGSKHQKKLRNTSFIQTITTNPNEPDFSTYRTPSGQFYCKNCNIVMNSDTQFTNHLQSRNHLKNLEPKSPSE